MSQANCISLSSLFLTFSFYYSTTIVTVLPSPRILIHKNFFETPRLAPFKKIPDWGVFFGKGGGGGNIKNSQCVGEVFLNRILKYIWKKKLLVGCTKFW